MPLALPDAGRALRPGRARRRLGGGRQRAGRQGRPAPVPAARRRPAPLARWPSPRARRGRSGAEPGAPGGRRPARRPRLARRGTTSSLSVRAAALDGPRAGRPPSRSPSRPGQPARAGRRRAGRRLLAARLERLRRPGRTRSSGAAAWATPGSPSAASRRRNAVPDITPALTATPGRRRADRLEPLRRQGLPSCGWPASRARAGADERAAAPSGSLYPILPRRRRSPACSTWTPCRAAGRCSTSTRRARDPGQGDGPLAARPPGRLASSGGDGPDALARREAAGGRAPGQGPVSRPPRRRAPPRWASALGRPVPRLRADGARRPTSPSATASPPGSGTTRRGPRLGYPPRLQTLLQTAGMSATVLNFGVARREDHRGAHPDRRRPCPRASPATCSILMEGTNDISRNISPRDHHLQPRDHGRARPRPCGMGVIHATVIPRHPDAKVDADNSLTDQLNGRIRNLAGPARARGPIPTRSTATCPNLFGSFYSNPGRSRRTPQRRGLRPAGPGLLQRDPGDRHGPSRARASSTRSNGARNVQPGHDDRSGRLGLRHRHRPREHLPAGQRPGRRRRSPQGTALQAHADAISPPAPLTGTVTVGLRSRDLADAAQHDRPRSSPASPSRAPARLQGDINQDGRVDGTDLIALRPHFGSQRGDTALQRERRLQRRRPDRRPRPRRPGGELRPVRRRPAAVELPLVHVPEGPQRPLGLGRLPLPRRPASAPSSSRRRGRAAAGAPPRTGGGEVVGLQRVLGEVVELEAAGGRVGRAGALAARVEDQLPGPLLDAVVEVRMLPGLGERLAEDRRARRRRPSASSGHRLFPSRPGTWRSGAISSRRVG